MSTKSNRRPVYEHQDRSGRGTCLLPEGALSIGWLLAVRGFFEFDTNQQDANLPDYSLQNGSGGFAPRSAASVRLNSVAITRSDWTLARRRHD
jgi:hypothetical protein